jgi:hypothetical protein
MGKPVDPLELAAGAGRAASEQRERPPPRPAVAQAAAAVARSAAVARGRRHRARRTGGADAAGLARQGGAARRGLAFLRRRITGDYEVDEFGFDADLTENVLLPPLRPLYDKWFRVEVRGIENIPDDRRRARRRQPLGHHPARL